jgi:hypothetical protein
VTPGPATPVAAPGVVEFGLALALVAAFAGGLLLNLMPCVLPVLSIKVLGFAGKREATRHRNGVLYAAGVLASFWLLAALLLGLRALGEELGWGFQLQSPPAVAVLALFFFALGLNLSGVFEFGNLLPDAAATWRSTGSSPACSPCWSRRRAPRRSWARRSATPSARAVHARSRSSLRSASGWPFPTPCSRGSRRG